MGSCTGPRPRRCAGLVEPQPVALSMAACRSQIYLGKCNEWLERAPAHRSEAARAARAGGEHVGDEMPVRQPAARAAAHRARRRPPKRAIAPHARPLAVVPQRKRVRLDAMPGAPGRQRSKRTKVSVGRARISLGHENASSFKPEMKQCGKLLRELMRNDLLARPFNKPVDPTLFPDYHTIVTDPIDLGTIKARLETGEYADRDEFAAEVRRVWDNCYKYNAPGTDVHRMATELSRAFEAKFKEVGTVVEAEVGAASSSNEMKKMQKQMAEMRKVMMEQTELLKQQQMNTQMLGAGVVAQQPARGGKKGRAAASNQYALVPAAQPAPETRDMTFEQKAELSKRINGLGPNNLQQVTAPVPGLATPVPRVLGVAARILSVQSVSGGEDHREIDAEPQGGRRRVRGAPTPSPKLTHPRSELKTPTHR